MTTSHSPHRPRRARTAVALAVAGLTVLAACGGDDDDPAAPEAPSSGAPATAAAPAAGDGYAYADPSRQAAATAAPDLSTGAAVATAETSLGTVLVDGAGLTLYAFTDDTDGEPTCVEACAGAWPPALVEGEPDVGSLDPSMFSTVEHPEGGTQLAAAGHPLYTFAGDAEPGDVNGQGSGGVWFAVAPDGTLVD